MLSADLICSAMYTPAPAPHIAGKVGSSHWQGVCTVWTESGEWHLVTGYDNTKPSLAACRASAPVDIPNIYAVIDRDHPAIAALNMKNAPHCHYTGPEV